MPARVIRRSTRRRVRSRRRTQWVDNAGDIAGIAIGNFQVIDLMSTYRPMDGAETAGISIQRVHFDFWVTSTVAVGDGIALGMAVDDMGEVNLTDQALGVAHAWNPVDQPYLPWMVYNRFNAHPHYSFNGAVDNLKFDVRTRRKVPFGDTLLLSIINVDASAAIDVAWHSRALIALS